MLCTTFPFYSRKQGSAALSPWAGLLAHRALVGRKLELIIPSRSSLVSVVLAFLSPAWGEGRNWTAAVPMTLDYQHSMLQIPWHSELRLLRSLAASQTCPWQNWQITQLMFLSSTWPGITHPSSSLTSPVLGFGLYLFTGLAASWPVHSQGLMQGGVCISTVI